VSDSRQHAVSLLRQLDEAPQLALVDLGLPPMPHRPDEGFQLISDLLAHSLAMKILVLSGQNDRCQRRGTRARSCRRVRRPSPVIRESQKILPAQPCSFGRLKSRGRDRRGRSFGRQESRTAKAEKPNQPIRRLALPGAHARANREQKTAMKWWANLLHRLSWRRVKPCVCRSTRGDSPTLVEPTLLAIPRAPYRRRRQNKSGLFSKTRATERCSRMQIGELPLRACQAKLSARALETAQFQRVGETHAAFSRFPGDCPPPPRPAPGNQEREFPRRPVSPRCPVFTIDGTVAARDGRATARYCSNTTVNSTAGHGEASRRSR